MIGAILAHTRLTPLLGNGAVVFTSSFRLKGGTSFTKGPVPHSILESSILVNEAGGSAPGTPCGEKVVGANEIMMPTRNPYSSG